MEKLSLEDLLKRDGYFVWKVKGVSMLPMLVQNRDIVTIRAKMPGERFRENDVVLYKRKRDRALTLHRVVQVTDCGYVILGDNCAAREYDIEDADILGVLTEFTHGDRCVRVTDPEYLDYVKKLRKNENRRILKRRIYSRVTSLVKKL